LVLLQQRLLLLAVHPPLLLEMVGKVVFPIIPAMAALVVVSPATEAGVVVRAVALLFAVAAEEVRADTTVMAVQAGTILEAFKWVVLAAEVQQGARQAVKNYSMSPILIFTPTRAAAVVGELVF
jgi:hypothetical protein